MHVLLTCMYLYFTWKYFMHIRSMYLAVKYLCKYHLSVICVIPYSMTFRSQIICEQGLQLDCSYSEDWEVWIRSRSVLVYCKRLCCSDLKSFSYSNNAEMYIISNLIKVSIPNYLASLPIPDSIGGWFHLGGKTYLFKNNYYILIYYLIRSLDIF